MLEAMICNAIGKDPMYKILHASRSHLIMYIHSGTGSIVCADKLYPLEGGSLVYIAADTYHYTMPDDPAQYCRSKLFLNPAQLEQALPASLLSEIAEKALICASIPPQLQEEVVSLFGQLSDTREATDHRLLLITSNILRLLYFLCHYAQDSTDASAGFLSRAIGYIHSNIAWDMTLDDICRAANVSKFHLCRRFREHTGMTVMDYILSTRLLLSKNELAKTDASVAQISEVCGFGSVSHFCRVFRKREGCTPLQYRKGLR